MLIIQLYLRDLTVKRSFFTNEKSREMIKVENFISFR